MYFLIGAAGVEGTDLGGSDAATGLICTNTICKVVIGSTKSGRTVVTHPLATSARRDLEGNTAVGG